VIEEKLGGFNMLATDGELKRASAVGVVGVD
jgi:hypothetical protein